MKRTVQQWVSAVLALCLLLPFPAVTAAEAESPETGASLEATVPETTAAAETTAATEATEPAANEEESGFSAPYHACFGLLHAHTAISDGLGTVEEAFQYASGVEGLDFFAVTDHSDSFDNAASGSLTADGRTVSAEWAAGRAAAAAVTSDTFLGLFGFEMSWPEDKRLGHIATFGTPGWVSHDQERYASASKGLQAYYEALAAVPGAISQFCHPGDHYGNFSSFRNWNKDYDKVIQLLEVASGQEGTAWGQYTAALDAGWHVAPTISQNNHTGSWGDADDGRTVVLAESLTEEDLFAAIRSRRVYATQDKDLHLYFDLNGYPMGEIMPVEEALQIALSWYDPTDGALGTVEVITEGGAVLATRTPAEDYVLIPVPEGCRYYYLRITQADGDIAVTAPVWVDLPNNVAIEDLTADRELPDQGDPVTLTLTLENGTREPITPEAVELYLGQTKVQTLKDPRSVPAGGSREYEIPYTHPEAGEAELRILVRAKGMEFEESLTLTYQAQETVTGMLIDGSHDNGGLNTLTALKALAAEAGLNVTTFEGDMPKGGELLLIQRPGSALEEDFIQDVSTFVSSGGTLILSGSGSEALLEALGSELSLTDTALEAGSSKTFNTKEDWCKKIVDGQYFVYSAGTAVTGGKWLVKSGSHVVLAWEKLASGGSIFLTGCDIFQGDALKGSESFWQLPRANRTILQAIVGQSETLLPQTDIKDVRKGTQGKLYRIQGYATAGTYNPYIRFPDTIYIQDETGGIAVTGFPGLELQEGEPIHLTGTLAKEGGNLLLKYQEHHQPGGDYHHYDPAARYVKAAMDYDAKGGQVMKIQGKVTALSLTKDKKGIRRLVIEDTRGDKAIVEIEESITSGVSGKNRLAKDIKKNRNVWAMGLVHINEKGETVLRVRDCDEVVWIKSEADKTNPGTGDKLWWLWRLF